MCLKTQLKIAKLKLTAFEGENSLHTNCCNSFNCCLIQQPSLFQTCMHIHNTFVFLPLKLDVKVIIYSEYLTIQVISKHKKVQKTLSTYGTKRGKDADNDDIIIEGARHKTLICREQNIKSVRQSFLLSFLRSVFY